MDLLGSPLGCAQRIPLDVAAFRVLSVWWKTSTSVSVLFRAVLLQLVPKPIMVTSFITLDQNLKI